MEEVWKDIQGYEGLYQVSNLGRVKSIERWIDSNHHVNERILKPMVERGGYVHVSLYKDKKAKHIKIHKLVAEAFIENKMNFKEINHIDENVKNNNASNLEWCNSEYNHQYGTRIERIKISKSKEISQFDLDGNFIRNYSSATEAEKELRGKFTTAIYRCLSGKQKTAYGYIWRYKEAE